MATNLDIDVPSVRVRGAFSLFGAPPPGTAIGTIELRNPTLGTVELGSIANGTYSRRVMPGTYDVVYKGGQGFGVPRNAETLLMQGVAITGSTVLDIAIPSVLVQGDILIDGVPVTSFYDHGNVRLRDRTTGAEFTIGESVDGSYAAFVIPGVYDVVWNRQLSDGVVPENADAIIAEAVPIAAATTLDIDVPSVVRTGSFKLNGANPPAGLYENGMVSLRDKRTGDVIPLGETRLQTYSRRIVPGTYDVLYSHILGDMVPRNAQAVIATGVNLTTAGDLTINIPMMEIAGDFTLDGAAFPVGLYNRAELWLRAGDDLVSLGTSDAGSYTALVVPGTYDVLYDALMANGDIPENTMAVVSSRHLKKPKGNAPGPVTLDVAVSSGIVAADVTLWGAPPPAGFYDNAEIRAAGIGDQFAVGETYLGGGSVRALAGTYDLRHRHLAGTVMAANTDATIGSATTDAGPAMIDLQPGALHGAFTQGGAPFPADPNQFGTLSLRDMATGEVILLGQSANQTYDKVLLGASYQVLYSHIGGDVVANRGATLDGCIRFAPLPPNGAY